jgi:serine/threonine protein kinase
VEGIIFMLRKGMFLADRYEIIEQIGTGGMSDVYKAKCHKLNRFVAIKVMKSEFSEDKTFVSKFRAEAQSVAGFTHPNIVNVYDVGDENGIYYIVMELVEGITLKKYIEKRGRIPFKEAVSIAIQVANGLDAAHKHNIVHRDIKPQNIIISKEGKVKVTDFGIAKVASSSTINSSSTMGSVHYISPEQARGGYSDARSDLYSLGITIFEMITGTVPFDGDSTVAVAVQHIQDEIPAPSTVTDDIPLSIDRIVLKLTQKKPDRRYQTAAELITDLKKSLVMPDTDFVVMAPLYGASGSASQVMPSNNNPVKDEDDNLSDDDFLDDSEDEEDDEQSKNELEDDSDDSDIDDENNDKLDLIMKIIGIGIAVIILIVTIFIIVKLVGSTKSNKNNNESKQTTESSIEQTSTSADDKNKVTVPKVEGMTKDDAIKALNEVGLGYRAVVQNSDRVSEGTVISQGTAAGKKVAKNTQIIITISGGKEVKNITVPSVTGKTESEARTALEADGFVVDVDYQYSSTVENGKVIKASPSGSVAQGSTITITVSRGKEIKNVTMANLIGKTESEAKQWIDSNGLKYSVKYTTTSGTYGNVVSCDYSEGTSVPEGTTVTITVSHKQETTTKATEADKNNNTNQGGSSNNNSNGNNNANGNNSDSNNQPKNAEQKSQN